MLEAHRAERPRAHASRARQQSYPNSHVRERGGL